MRFFVLSEASALAITSFTLPPLIASQTASVPTVSFPAFLASPISEIIRELGGEKIDVVRYSEKPEEYVSAALSPAEVKSVEMDGERSCKVIVAPDQLSLSIGKEGQNARLAARLTGYKIDIKTV